MTQGTDNRPQHRGPERRRRCEVCGSTDGTLARELTGNGTAVRATLCDRHGSQLTVLVHRWLASQAARSLAGRGVQSGRRLRDGESMEAIREWAVAAGYQAAGQGSLSNSVMAAYRTAHPVDATDAPDIGPLSL